MARFTIRLESIEIVSTRNPPPYWDDLQLVFDVLTPKAIVQITQPEERAETLKARLGLFGSGAMVPLHGRLDDKGRSLSFDVDIDEENGVFFYIALLNVRDLTNSQVARLLTELGISVTGAILGTVVPAADALQKAAWAVGGALGAKGISALVDKIFVERPDCTGRIGFVGALIYNAEQILELPYEVRMPEVPVLQTPVEKRAYLMDTLTGQNEEPAPCQDSLFRATVAFEYETVVPPVSSPKNLLESLIDGDPRAWVGEYASDPKANWESPRVRVILTQPDNASGEPAVFNCHVAELDADNNVVVSLDRMWVYFSNADLFVQYEREIYGRKALFKPKEVFEKQLSPNKAFGLSQNEAFSFIDSQALLFPQTTMTRGLGKTFNRRRQTGDIPRIKGPLTMALADIGVELSLYRVIGPNGESKAIRYRRMGGGHTLTDVMMTPWQKLR